MLHAVWLIPALPLTGFLVLLLAGRKLGDPEAGWLATAMVAASFVVTLLVFFALLGRHGEERHFTQSLYDWVPAGGLKVDLGFLVDPLSITMALFVIFATVGSLSYTTVLAAAPTLAHTTVTAIALLLFLGAVGKSAQLPLYVWLPDAMEGPTPVSALIHAATMVTAGVFLMCRINPILHEATGAATLI